MLSKLIMKLKTDSKEYSYQLGSVMQGVMMECISSEYAARMHSGNLNPYSQAVYKKNEEIYWEVNALNEEAKTEVIQKLIEQDSVFLKKKKQSLAIIQREYQEIDEMQLFKKFYQEDVGNIIRLSFFTPTAFKQNGKYTFTPDIRCIYQSLMRKYDAVAKKEKMFDEEMCDCLVESTHILDYNLRSTRFFVEKVTIPSFIGKITLKVRGPQTLVNFANLLFEFAKYSGVGIKTSMGMGKVKTENNKEKRKNDR